MAKALLLLVAHGGASPGEPRMFPAEAKPACRVYGAREVFAIMEFRCVGFRGQDVVGVRSRLMMLDLQYTPCLTSSASLPLCKSIILISTRTVLDRLCFRSCRHRSGVCI